MDLLYLNCYGPRKFLGNRYILVATYRFSKLGWTVALIIKISHSLESSSENILTSSKKTKVN